MGAEVVADGEEQLVLAGKRVGEKRGVAAAIRVGEGVGEQFAVAVEADADTSGRIAGNRVENVSREFSHSLKKSRWRAGMQDRGILT